MIGNQSVDKKQRPKDKTKGGGGEEEKEKQTKTLTRGSRKLQAWRKGSSADKTRGLCVYKAVGERKALSDHANWMKSL